MTASYINLKGLAIFGMLFTLLVSILTFAAQLQATGVAEIGTNYSHGLSKHGASSAIALQCFQDKGADLIYRMGDNENKAVQLCLIPDDGGLAVRVVKLINGKWEEITSYVNPEATTVDDMVVYAESHMGNYGYVAWMKECWRGIILLPVVEENNSN